MTTPRKPLPPIDPCPFCGRAGEVLPYGMFVNCVGSRCKATGPKRDTLRGAINAWNARKVECNG